MQKKKNIDEKVVNDFGKEWNRFNHLEIDKSSLQDSFESYFSIFPFEALPKNAEGFDMGCGSGRWAKFVAPMIYKLNCIDPSELALKQANQNLSQYSNAKDYLSLYDKRLMSHLQQHLMRQLVVNPR